MINLTPRLLLSGLCALVSGVAIGAAFPGAARRDADAGQFCTFIDTEYAYFDRKATEWTETCDELRRAARAARSRDEFVSTLETALSQLYDSHAHLGTNIRTSLRLVPSGSQLRLSWRGDHAMVTDVRQDSAAERAGLRAGDEVLSLDGVGIATAAGSIEPRHLSRADPLARDWALNAIVAGRHSQATRTLRVRSRAGDRTLQFPADDVGSRPGLLESRRIGDVGYVRVHNSLGQNALVQAFDNAIRELSGVRGFVLDLRDTPSGGTSNVARGIMGHFVPAVRPYQRHEYVAEGHQTGVPRSWIEEVSPRMPQWDIPVVVLVGAWTASMGEGIAIGLNGARNAPVLGSGMAHLLGALGEVRLANSGIPVRIPNERLFHVNGPARESFVPQAISESTSGDGALEQAIRRASADTADE